MKEVCFFTIADNNNLRYCEMMKKSLEKFHPDIPLILFGQNQIALAGATDPQLFYRATPFFARRLLNEYKTVIKLDADQVVCGSLEHLWKGADYDLGCVLNGNPTEPPYTVWDIHPAEYMNCGLVAVRNLELVDHWWRLCEGPHFNTYQFREQDLMNIIYHYGNYKVKCFDHSDNWHGLVSKGYWQYIELRGNEFVLPKGDRDWPMDKDKTIRVIHWAGGNEPNKMNFNIRFQPEVAKKLEWLTK